MMNPTLESVSLDIGGHAIAGIRQRDKAQAHAPALLCIHGWLDNANSFMPLLPYLPAFDILAVDLPGHGYSDPLTQGYTLHDLCFQLICVIQKMGWQHCHVVGHSLGGAIAPMLAVAKPDCVQSLTLIEATGPLSEPATELPTRMAKALHDRLNPARFQSRVFNEKQEAIDARLRAATMSQASAKLIIDRQLQQSDDGYRWRFDPSWRYASWQYQTEEQVTAILRALSCPVLSVIADQGFLVQRPETQPRLDCLQHHQSLALPGHHHVHMDTPEPVAAAINRFLGTLPALGG